MIAESREAFTVRRAMRSNRRVVSWLVASVLVLSAVGCSDAGRPPSAVDGRFVAAMVPHHLLGLELIELAEVRADDVRLRRLVFEMTAYHHEELHSLEERLDTWGVEPAEEFPGSLAPDVMAALEIAHGKEFDLAWLAAMIEHHQGAVEIAGDQFREGADAGLREVARRVGVVQSAEIDEMESLVQQLDV